MARFLKKNRQSVFVVVGDGTDTEKIRQICEAEKVSDQLVMTGAKTGQALADAYKAFNIFVFASKTETQGMVLTEAMAAGAPVLALDASGVREVLKDGKNGRMLDANASSDAFARCLEDIFHHPETLKGWEQGVFRTAMDFSRQISAKSLENLYLSLITTLNDQPTAPDDVEFPGWDDLLKTIDVEWGLLVEKAKAFIHSSESGTHLKDVEE